MTTSIPAHWASTGQGLPTCCAKHGNPAEEYHGFRMISRPPAWSYVLLLVAVFVFVIVARAVRKTVNAVNWPFCAQCRALRKRNLTIGLSVIALAALLCVPFVALSGGDQSGLAVLSFFAALVAFLVGVIVAGRGSWAGLARGEVSQDGTWVLVKKAHPAFAQQVASTLEAANAQYAAAAQAYNATAYGQNAYPHPPTS